MSRRVTHIFFFALLITLTNQCVEPFEADVPAKDIQVLVVEGYINAGPGISTFKLSHATALSQSDAISFEREATLTIESNTNESFALTETSAGIYKSGELNLPVDGTYRLNIKLKDGNEYRSEFLPVKVTPVIDSINWEWLPDYLYLFVNAHDAENETHYYQWQYEEDWQIQSPQFSYLKYENDTIVPRPIDEMLLMYYCWGTAKSGGLIFASTDLFTADVMKFPIQKLPHGAERTSVRYSILVHQHTVQQDEYDYMKLVEKNSTQVGSFFDPMPAQLFGNIAAVNDPDELVLGFVGSYTTETKRLYISNAELPSTPVRISCENDAVDFVFSPENLSLNFGNNVYTPTAIYVDPFTRDLRVSGMSTYCFDCRLRGSSLKPSFWE